MFKVILHVVTLLLFSFISQAQSNGSGILSGVSGVLKGGLSSEDISKGLKEALSKGATTAAKQLSATDGYYGNPTVKILMPPEAQKIEKKLRDFGMGEQVDDAILSMNRAAENAAQSATPIFIDAIKNMGITDASGILQGNDTAATSYLKGKTTSQLTETFKPVIKTSLDKVDATSKWATIIDLYNKIPFVKKMNPDLAAYVTERALFGMFVQVAQQEKLIRKDPLVQTTSLLKKVFGQKAN